MKNFALEGSLRIHATNVTGSTGPEGRIFHENVGRAHLHNVSIKNKGRTQRTPSPEAAHTYEETCSFFLEGFSELYAENVTFDGSFSLVVPDGKRAIITQDANSKISVRFEPITSPSWTYAVSWQTGTAPTLKVMTQKN
jgi:hypothetical protein